MRGDGRGGPWGHATVPAISGGGRIAIGDRQDRDSVMVLPSNDHDDLRQWLSTHGVGATEIAGRFITDDLDPLLAVAGSRYRLTPEQQQAVASARAMRDDAVSGGSPADPSAMDQQAEVAEVVEEVCDALRVVGISAVPFEGLGVTFGDELLDARLLISNLAPLYQRMAAGTPRRASPRF